MPLNRPTRAAASAVVLATAATVPATAAADVAPLIDVRLGIGVWEPDWSGGVNSEGNGAFDVEDDLGFDDTRSNTFEAALEHPVPLLPNVRFDHVNIDDDHSGTLTVDRDFGGETFSSDERVDSAYDLEMTDLTLYYSPLDNVVSLDVGVTARHADLEVEVDSRANDVSGREDGSAILPLGYLALRADLPLNGVYATGTAKGISAGGDSLHDIEVGLGWEPGSTFGIEAGYRELGLDIDETDDLEADVDLGGAYLTASLRF